MIEQDNDLILFDRINAIRDVIKKYGIENFYIAFSGGKDSTILSHLIDEALPNNQIPRVYTNTGIEYQENIKFIRKLQSTDKRIVIIKPSTNIKKMLEENGYPFKSKIHSQMVYDYQNKIYNPNIINYINKLDNKLKYQFTDKFNIKVSKLCCTKLKKEPSMKWQKENNKSIIITGLRNEEGGYRAKMNCIYIKNNKGTFHPLMKVNEEFINWYIKKRNILLSNMYYKPFEAKRTGCKGCPYNMFLKQDLEKLKMYYTNEYNQACTIWKKIYDEYKRIGFRL